MLRIEEKARLEQSADQRSPEGEGRSQEKMERYVRLHGKNVKI